ncbi:dixin isoform X3 [Octopus bimaculoides]|uniref:dixin isoform X3 n=1 Tax=Octopus bimaculoides TaxID=37653 RepID=UPI00071E243F|nr:dixin isoform X3 [Octopus bimaculoides]|eukprot:XP_014789922.1 PREDICTED: dixin-like isoform X3 [Octopus bimaculoides]
MSSYETDDEETSLEISLSDLVFPEVLQQQLHAYEAWVNAQLRKRPSARQIEDLRNDVKDGVALINLIEVVGGEKLQNVHMVPSTHAEMKANVERVLQFMSANHIRMHPMKASDIVDGNLKCIMRLILALAAHFKPNSVKHQSVAGVISPNRGRSLASIAQSAAVTLATARRFVSKASKQYHGSNYKDYGHTTHIPADVAAMQARMMMIKSCPGPKHLSATGEQDYDIDGMPRSRSTGFIPANEDSVEYGQDNTVILDQQQYNDLLKEYDDLADTMKETKSDLLKLQNLLLNGEITSLVPSSELDDLEGYSISDQMVVLRSRLQQATEISRDLKEQLSRTKIECRELYGAKAGLQQRLAEQEVTLANSKADLYRRSLDFQSLESEKNMLIKKLNEKDKQLTELKRDVSQKDKVIEDLQFQMNPELLEEKDVMRRNCWLHIRCLQKLQSMRRTESMKKDKEDSVVDVQMIQGSIEKLRLSFNDNDQEKLSSLDQLEQNVITFIEKMHYGSIDILPQSPTLKLSRPVLPSHFKEDAQGNYMTSTITATNSASIKQLETKVLYYLDNSETSHMITVPKRLGEITLKDLQNRIQKSEGYRFQFKALDPEFGTVKEELFNGKDILPGWEGKIVAWVTEKKTE